MPLSCKTLAAETMVVGGSAAMPKHTAVRRLQVNSRRKLEDAEPLAYKPRQRSQPIFDAERGWLFVGTRLGKVLALDGKSLKSRWSLDLQSSIDGPMLLKGDLLYVATARGLVYARSAATGAAVWERELGVELGAPMVLSESGLLLVPSVAGDLSVLLADSGKIQWQARGHSGKKISLRGAAAPSIHGDQVIVPFSDGSVASYQLSDGRERWRRRLPSSGPFEDIDTQALIYEERAIVATPEGKLVALDLKTGEPVWESASGLVGTSYLLLERGTLVLVGNDKVAGLDPSTGSLRWSTQLPEGPLSAPVAAGDALYIGAESGSLHAISLRDGRPIASFTPGPGVSAPPAVASDRLYVFSNGGVLYRLDD